MVLLRPRRKVVAEAEGWAVVPSVGAPFSTTYEPLARQVAYEFDRIDPLPFPAHDCTEETETVRTLGGHGRTYCRQCGHVLD